ncbi:MAG TPA: hypothetical protein VJ829_16830, partial [Candidatus Binatia bacterium]|nr:hypothetical protein [Candidatus Binatia bacterium]
MNARNRRCRPPAAVIVVLLSSSLAPRARAQQLDCDDVDHECAAGTAVAVGIKRAGGALLECLRERAGSCDLESSLAGVRSEECREAVECQLAELRDLVNDGSTSCAERLFREAYRFMARKATRIARG